MKRPNTKLRKPIFGLLVKLSAAFIGLFIIAVIGSLAVALYYLPNPQILVQAFQNLEVVNIQETSVPVAFSPEERLTYYEPQAPSATQSSDQPRLASAQTLQYLVLRSLSRDYEKTDIQTCDYLDRANQAKSANWKNFDQLVQEQQQNLDFRNPHIEARLPVVTFLLRLKSVRALIEKAPENLASQQNEFLAKLSFYSQMPMILAEIEKRRDEFYSLAARSEYLQKITAAVQLMPSLAVDPKALDLCFRIQEQINQQRVTSESGDLHEVDEWLASLGLTDRDLSQM